MSSAHLRMASSPPTSCQVHVNSCCIGTRTRQFARVETQPLPNRAAFGQGGTATCLKALNSRTFSQDWSKYPTCALRTGRKSSCILHPGLDSCGFIRTRKIGCTPAAVKSRSKRMNPALLLFAHARFGAQVGYFDHNRKNVRVRCPRHSISMQEGREFAHKYT